MYEIGQRIAGSTMWRTIGSDPGAVGARGVEQMLGNRADRRGEDDHAERRADEAVGQDDHQQRMIVAQVDRRHAEDVDQHLVQQAALVGIDAPTATAARTPPTGSCAAAARRRGRTRRAPRGTAVVTSASSSANVTLKIAERGQHEHRGDAERREQARCRALSIRSKFSSVSVVTASVRSMSVNARTRSTIDRRDEEARKQDQRRAEEQREVGALAASLRAGEVGHEEPRQCRPGQRSRPVPRRTSSDHHVLAELVLELADHEVGRGLRRETARLDALDALEDDRVVLADLRVVGHEARVLQHRCRGHQRPPLVDDLGHRLLAVVDRRVVGGHRMLACSE